MVAPHRSSPPGGSLPDPAALGAPPMGRARLAPIRWLWASLGIVGWGAVSVGIVPFSWLPARAQQSGYGQTMGSTPVESQIYNYDPSSGNRTGSSSEGINPANPLDLINKIRKGTAMDNATPPGDAVDQALKELEAQSRPEIGRAHV